MNFIIAENTAFVPPPGKKKQFAEGIIRVRRIPDWTEAEYRYWWLPETNGKGKIVRPARMREKEKEQYQIGEYANAIMNAGRTAVLSYMGSSTGSTTQWSQYLALGTGAISAVNPTDTTLANEVYRVAQTTYSTNGTQLDVNFNIGATSGEFSYTNAGIYGAGATSTLNSGTLMTHALFAYTKGAYSIAIDYLINLL
jgi:hypothetical protein